MEQSAPVFPPTPSIPTVVTLSNDSSKIFSKTLFKTITVIVSLIIIAGGTFTSTYLIQKQEIHDVILACQPKVTPSPSPTQSPSPTTSPTPTPTVDPSSSPTTSPAPTLSPSPTPISTGEVSCQCQFIRAYDTEWNELLTDDLEKIKAGDIIRYTVSGNASDGIDKITKARFAINGSIMPETTLRVPGKSGEFYMEYIIPDGVTSFQVEAEIYHEELGWV